MSLPTVIEAVPNPSAATAGLRVGDQLVAITGISPADVIEYQHLINTTTMPGVAASAKAPVVAAEATVSGLLGNVR